MPDFYQKMTKTFLKFRSRITIVSVLVLFSWVGLSVTLFRVQILNGAVYRAEGIRQGKSKESLPAIRGNIYDRNNTPLTRNIIHYTFAAHPSKVTDKSKLAQTFSDVTKRPADYYLKKLESGKNFIYLERNLKKDQCAGLLDDPVDGLYIERNTRRFYPHGSIASQIVGCSDVDDRGITGIENRFEEFLRGKSGWIVKQRNGLGGSNPKNSFPIQAPVDGQNIQLTIDLDYQSILQEELHTQRVKTNATSATGIILNPHTGEIYAMASLPDFDPNKPSAAPVEYQKLRAITDQFEPGSTFKIVTATAALAGKTVDPLDEFNCENGSFMYKNIRINDHEEYGTLTFSQIIQYSSNVGTIKIAETVGKNKLYRTARDYGFGTPTKISLLGETQGLLRTPSEWSDISLAEISMGHEVGATAMQLAMAYSAIANGGFLIKPRLVRQIVDFNNTIVYREKPEVIRKVSTSAVMNDVKDMLVQVVQNGTGTTANLPGWNVAGKTGTAQKFINGKYSNYKYVSNFVGFFPADDPQLLAVIVLDEPNMPYHWGAIGAAPVFKKVMQRIINMDDSIQIPPAKIKEPQIKDVILVEHQDVQKESPALLPMLQKSIAVDSKDNTAAVPDVRGMSLRKAITVLRKAGLRTKLSGSGKVYWQSPAPGTILKNGAICTIGLK